MFWTAVWWKTWDGCFWRYVCKTIYWCSRKVTLTVFTQMCSASFVMEIKMYSQEIQWELAEKILFQEICASYESLKKRDHWKKDPVTFLPLLKLLKLKNNSITALRLLKFLILKKGLHHFLTTFKVINVKKGLNHFLTTLIVFNPNLGVGR